MSIEGRKYLTPELANHRDFEAIKIATILLAQSIPVLTEQEDITNLTIAGTHAEVINHILKPADYLGIKAQLGSIANQDPFVAMVAKETIANDPDFDIYIWNDQIKLQDIATNFAALLSQQKHDKQDRYHIDASHDITISLGPISDKNDKPRLHLQLIYTGGDKDENCFHFDLTRPPITRLEKGHERRILNGGLADSVQNPLTPTTEGFIVSRNKREKLLLDYHAQRKINLAKDDISVVISSLRNTRKLISAFRAEYKLGFTNLETYFRGQAIAHHLPENILGWSFEELKNIYREILVSAAYDPAQTLRYLHQSGLDQVFFGATIDPNLFFKTDKELNINQFYKFFKNSQIDLAHLLKVWTDSSFTSLLAPLPQT